VSLGIKHEDREDNDVNEVAKVNQDGWTELVDNTAQHVNDAAQHVDPYASLHSKDRDTLLEWDAEEDSMTEDLKLIDKDIKKLSKRWEEIEEKRRGALTSKKDEGKGGGSKQDPSEPVSEDDVLQKGNSASLSTTFIQREAELLLKTLGEFASFPSSVPSKLIQIGDDFEYVARSFAHAEPKMEQDTRTAEDAVAKRKLEEIRKHKAAQAESSKPDTVVSGNKWLEIAKTFAEKKTQYPERGKTGDIKVALIDDGIEWPQFVDLPGCVHLPGFPIPQANSSDELWYHSANGHGSKMAKLILEVCRGVELYVAKLADWQAGDKIGMRELGQKTTVESAAEAVKWAISKNVDVISMSWCLIRNPTNTGAIEELDRQLSLAAGQKIIMFCAAADKGPYDEGLDQELWPSEANTKHITVVGSSDVSGSRSTMVNEKQAHILIPGEEIEELKVANKQGSSSASTALAAGLAAQILWCYKQEKGDAKPIRTQANILKVFEKLQTQKSKWINVMPLLMKSETEQREIAGVVKCVEGILQLDSD